MLYHAPWMRMLAFCWLDPKFRFHACHFVHSPVLALSALSSTSLFQSHFTHLLLLLHPTIVYYSCQNPMSCTNTDGFWTLAKFFSFYQRVRTVYVCARRLTGGCFDQGVNHSTPYTRAQRIAYYYTISCQPIQVVCHYKPRRVCCI